MRPIKTTFVVFLRAIMPAMPFLFKGLCVGMWKALNDTLHSPKFYRLEAPASGWKQKRDSLISSASQTLRLPAVRQPTVGWTMKPWMGSLSLHPSSGSVAAIKAAAHLNWFGAFLLLFHPLSKGMQQQQASFLTNRPQVILRAEIIKLNIDFRCLFLPFSWKDWTQLIVGALCHRARNQLGGK